MAKKRASAPSSDKPKSTAKKRAPKTRADAPGASPDNGRAVPGDNSRRGSLLTEDQTRELFLQHRTAWNSYQAKLKAVEELGKDVKAALKSDGFLVEHMKVADDLATVKGEKRVTDNVRVRLQVARWIGHPMGAQLDMFEQPDRTPAVDKAYDQGKMASMKNEARKPPYAPDLPQYRSWIDGYNDHQEELAQGFKRTEAAAPEPDEPAIGGDEPVAGVHVSRTEFNRQLAENTAAADRAIREHGEGAQ